MTRFLLSISVCCFMAGCASAPVNFGKPDPSARVGMIYLVNERPNHSHVGTTMFQNFVKNDATETDFRSQFESRTQDLLKRGGYQVRTIEPTGVLIENRDDLFSYASSDVFFETSIKIELNRLAAEDNLDFIIVLYPLVGPAWANSSAYLEGYGLYTRCRYGSCTAEALNYVSARIYDANNQSSLKAAGGRFFDFPAIPGAPEIEDPESVDAELIDEAAAIALDAFMDRFASMLRASQFIE